MGAGTGLRGETVMHLSLFVLKEGFRVEPMKSPTRSLSRLDKRARNFGPGFGSCQMKFGIWGVSSSRYPSPTFFLGTLTPSLPLVY